MTTEREVRLNLTANQNSPLGRVLHKLYYGDGELLSLCPGDQWGYPHNGGQHTFHVISREREDTIAWLELIAEKFVQVRSAFQDIIKDIRAGVVWIRASDYGKIA